MSRPRQPPPAYVRVGRVGVILSARTAKTKLSTWLQTLYINFAFYVIFTENPRTDSHEKLYETSLFPPVLPRGESCETRSVTSEALYPYLLTASLFTIAGVLLVGLLCYPVHLAGATDASQNLTVTDQEYWQSPQEYWQSPAEDMQARDAGRCNGAPTSSGMASPAAKFALPTTWERRTV